MKRVVIHSFIGIGLAFFLVSCANMSATLVGGPKDITPPRLVFSIPAFKTTNFKGRKVEITFDEFLKQTEVAKELVISPPLKKRPTVILRNKSIYIILDEKDTFKRNTTYTFYFANSVQDLNEGNQLRDFQFVFSTGDVVDSLSLRGRVLNSFDHTADKDRYYVMLYDRFDDSIPRKQLPTYVTRTDEKGYFTMTHLRADSFMIFALKDGNQNLLFDLPNEMIGFSDTLVHLTTQYYVPQDSVILKDTVKFDSVRNANPYLKPQIGIYTFVEDFQKQYISKYDRPVLNRFNLIFNRPLFDSISITPLNFISNHWYLKDKNNVSDTLSYWITDTTLIHRDSLQMIISYTKLDSIGNLMSTNDTILLKNKKVFGNKVAKKDEKKKKVNDFKISSHAENRDGFDLNNTVNIMTSFPVQSIKLDKIKIFKIPDTKEKKNTPVNFSLVKDSDCIRNYWVHMPFEPNTEYIISADSAAFTSIYNQVTDSTGFHFKTQKDDYYGTLNLNISNVRQHMIVQIIGSHDAVIKEKYTDADGPVVFDYLMPGKYKIKVIYDRNKNNFWDTGNFKERNQPEQVDYFKGIINIRSNWDLNETWQLK